MKLTGLQAEFRFVMRIDEIELPVYDPIAGGIQCRLKLLYGTRMVGSFSPAAANTPL